MAKILQVIANNLKHGPATVRLPGSVPVPEGFRGRVRIDPAHCLACGMCSYVCVSNAITGLNGPAAFQWAYDPGRCTFCARCMERCPGSALSMECAPAPIYRKRGDLRVSFDIALPACPECGAPNRPVTSNLVDLAFGETITDELRAVMKLCPTCRRRRMSSAFAEALHGKE